MPSKKTLSEVKVETKIPKQLYDKLEAIAREYGFSVYELVRNIIFEFVRKHEKRRIEVKLERIGLGVAYGSEQR